MIIINTAAAATTTFKQGIDNYVPETNHVSTAYSVAAIQ